jgi:hypothetical protein
MLLGEEDDDDLGVGEDVDGLVDAGVGAVDGGVVFVGEEDAGGAVAGFGEGHFDGVIVEGFVGKEAIDGGGVGVGGVVPSAEEEVDGLLVAGDFDGDAREGVSLLIDDAEGDPDFLGVAEGGGGGGDGEEEEAAVEGEEGGEGEGGEGEGDAHGDLRDVERTGGKEGSKEMAEAMGAGASVAF